MFHKNGMRPLIILNGTKCCSILCCNSQSLHIRLKYKYAVISIIVDSPGNTKQQKIDKFVVFGVRLVHSWAELDVVSDGHLHNQLLHFFQNARMAFLGRNTPTPLLSEFMTEVDDTVVEVVCRHGTGGGHVDWSPHLRKFAQVSSVQPITKLSQLIIDDRR